MSRLHELIHEIHRRSLWQVLGIYVVASWAVLQVVDTVSGALRLPDWLEPVALVLLVVGLPVVLATAFVQEGISRQEEKGENASAETPAPSLRWFTWRNALAGGVLAFAIWGIVAAGWLMLGGASQHMVAGASGIERSIAVMPCDDLSPTADQQPLAQGVAEEVSLALARLDDMEKVIGRQSTATLKDRGADLSTVASTLGVSNVLNCTVLRDGAAVRVTATLTDARSGGVLWGERFDEQYTNVIGVLDRIARSVADELDLALTEPEGEHLVPEGTHDADALEADLRGRYLLYQRGEANLHDAIQSFQEAIERDPEYAEAYAGLARATMLSVLYAVDPGSIDVRAVLERGAVAARRAVSLAPELGLGHAALAMNAAIVGEFEEARREGALAVRLAPASAEAFFTAATIEGFTGHAAESLELSERARALDPLNPQIAFGYGSALRAVGRLDDALGTTRDLTRLHPGFANGWFQLLSMLVEAGRYEEAQEAWNNLGQAWDVEQRAAWQDAFGRIRRFRETGERGPAPDLSRVPYVNRGQVDVLFGQDSQAVAWLTDAVNRGAYIFVALFDDFVPPRLRDDPAYQSLRTQAAITW